MAALFGYATFPGIRTILRASYTLAHGITPGTASIEMAPQAVLPASDGTLTFFFGGVVIPLPFCRLNAFSFNRSENGLVWTVQILDRRWRWQFGRISGIYNVRNGDETLDRTTEKTPQELATLLLTAMGEAAFDVSQLPNDTRPPVNWCYANPAQELADLCDSLGCHVVLQINNRVKVCRIGVGAELPNLPIIMDASGQIDPPDGPDTIEYVVGDTVVQGAVNLEAVGLDTDGKIKKINDLSYKPSAGWGGSVTGQYTNVTNSTPSSVAGQQTNPRQLAVQTVFKWYRIRSLFGTDADRKLSAELGRDFGFAFNSINQFLPLGTEILTVDPNSNPKRNLPAFVQGTFADLNSSTVANSSTYADYRRPFRIIPDKGIVEFQDYVYKWSSPGSTTSQLAEALLVLVTTFPVKNHLRRDAHRFVRPARTGLRGITGAQVIKEDGLSLSVRFAYSGANITGITTNRRDVEKEADKAILAAAQRYQTKRPYDITYAGLVPINPDGAVQQVTWSVAEGEGATTRSSRNNEYSLLFPSYNERRFYERLRGEPIRQMQQNFQRIDEALRRIGGRT